MIKANELRIGNWVNQRNRKYIGKEVWPFQIRVQDLKMLEGKSTWKERIEGIPITPDILLKCGFHKDNYGVFEKVKNNEPYISGCEIELWTKEVNGKWEFCVGEDFDNLFTIASIQYLHQLQNLYFSLTNNELNIEGL